MISEIIRIEIESSESRDRSLTIEDLRPDWPDVL